MRDCGDYSDLSGVWTPAAAAWFRERVRLILELARAEPDPAASTLSVYVMAALRKPDAIPWLVAWFADRHARYCRWIPDAVYDPGNDSSGKWTVVDEEILDAVDRHAGPAFRRYRLRADEAEACPTLDDWLAQLHRGALAWRGPAERPGEHYVEKPATFRAEASARQRTWPRLCVSCGREFRPERVNGARCRRCRAKRRRARA